MRKTAIAIILFLMMTCAAFAEDEPATDVPATDLAGGLEEELQMEPQAEPQTEPLEESQVELQAEPQREAINLSTVKLKLTQTSYSATGSEIKPEPRLMLDVTELTNLVKDKDYELVYDKNIKPGTATVKAVAKEGGQCVYPSETEPVQFTITAIDLSNTTMKLGDTAYYKTGSAITPKPILKYDGTTLTNGTDYTVSYKNNTYVGTATVTATALTGSRFKGSKSMTFSIIPKKPLAPSITKVKSNKPYVTVTWKTVTCTGYELQISRNRDFSNPTTYWIKATTKKVPKLKSGKKHYFRVRAYNTENSKTTYGSWWWTCCKVATTGSVGNKYSKDGAYIKNKTIKLNDNYYYYNSDGLKSGCSKTMWDNVKGTSSKTKYLIAVDCTKNRVCIYKGKKGNWKLQDYWKCTTGKKSTPTIKGKFKVCGKVSHFGEQKGYSVWYATRIKYEYYFHSILYKPWSKKAILNGTLGKNLSHGCIRLKMSNAKWIYKNCKGGTRIVIY